MREDINLNQKMKGITSKDFSPVSSSLVEHQDSSAIKPYSCVESVGKGWHHSTALTLILNLLILKK